MVWILLIVVCSRLISPSEAGPAEFVPILPEHCTTATVCEDVLNYPRERVNNILQTLDYERYDLRVEGMITPEKMEYHLCNSTKTVLYPKAAKNKEGTWQFILNQDNNPVQGVVAEICGASAIDQPCGNGVGVTFRSGYTSHCKQKFIYRYMLGLDAQGSIIDITTEMPSCCSCVVAKNDTSR